MLLRYPRQYVIVPASMQILRKELRLLHSLSSAAWRGHPRLLSALLPAEYTQTDQPFICRIIDILLGLSVKSIYITECF